MQFKSVISVIVLAFSISACSSIDKVVYRIDVPQGNYLEAATVNQLQVGMNVQQVQYLLGTPVLIDPFNNNKWYYVFLQQKAYQTPEQRTLIVNFDKRGLVTSFDLDKPLPDESKPAINNAIIQAENTAAKRWWQFWK
ncbi:outer membrane protein assembly factor BamE [Pasteurella canis]|uniref:Outer membrane protein assembly factor BamE n=1 Tax=Pasteurella canis TaxID=753 RepID=A0A379EVS1_9PAST|nr:outer membrane protein assembly factor BamE [Pasteurella canis]UAX41574.1 outer membrane protein assembly factor BamE [Pasteurella canis]UDW83130.1 outer membrane protein assembly factor BamE [Pasteurella canis]UEA16217.1 outer membrane protein assembly factor BamE [Pasteurella canis]UEC22656.1 outer membrane protein assembly factor BamE [Pasteurella canis]SPY32661.1 small protein A [Pasteurella canis]